MPNLSARFSSSTSPAPPWNLHLLLALVKRDFKAQYRRSLIGPAWAILHSVIYLGLFVAIRSFLGIPSDDRPYAIFAAVAIVPWTFFAGAVARASTSILLNNQLLKKMAVRREIFPAASVVLSLVDLIVASSLIFILLFWYGLNVSWSLVFLPFFIALLAANALGVGMMVASVGVYKRDVVLGLPFLVQIWMLASPIMYPLSVVPERWQLLYSINPIVGIVEGIRAILLDGALPHAGLTALSIVGTALVFFFGWTLFRHVSQYFVDAL